MSKGIIRQIDELGRIVLPKEMRKSLDIDSKDPLEIIMMENGFMIKKCPVDCALCGSTEDLVDYEVAAGTDRKEVKKVCASCLKNLAQIANQSETTGI